MAQSSQLVEFARAPLLWSAAFLLVYAPFALFTPVTDPPMETCSDYMDCNWRFVGLAFDGLPDAFDLFALAIIPGALGAFFAARVAAGGPNRAAHWFMAPTIAAAILFTALLYWLPLHMFFINMGASDPLAVFVHTQHNALLLTAVASLPLALLTLLGAWIWRLRSGR